MGNQINFRPYTAANDYANDLKSDENLNLTREKLLNNAIGKFTDYEVHKDDQKEKDELVDLQTEGERAVRDKQFVDSEKRRFDIWQKGKKQYEEELARKKEIDAYNDRQKAAKDAADAKEKLVWNDPTRTYMNDIVYKGLHAKSMEKLNEGLKNKMQMLSNQGMQEGWSPERYKEESRKVLKDSLDAGIITEEDVKRLNNDYGLAKDMYDLDKNFISGSNYNSTRAACEEIYSNPKISDENKVILLHRVGEYAFHNKYISQKQYDDITNHYGDIILEGQLKTYVAGFDGSQADVKIIKGLLKGLNDPMNPEMLYSLGYNYNGRERAIALVNKYIDENHLPLSNDAIEESKNKYIEGYATDIYNKTGTQLVDLGDQGWDKFTSNYARFDNDVAGEISKMSSLDERKEYMTHYGFGSDSLISDGVKHKIMNRKGSPEERFEYAYKYINGGKNYGVKYIDDELLNNGLHNMGIQSVESYTVYQQIPDAKTGRGLKKNISSDDLLGYFSNVVDKKQTAEIEGFKRFNVRNGTAWRNKELEDTVADVIYGKLRRYAAQDTSGKLLGDPKYNVLKGGFDKKDVGAVMGMLTKAQKKDIEDSIADVLSIQMGSNITMVESGNGEYVPFFGDRDMVRKDTDSYIDVATNLPDNQKMYIQGADGNMHQVSKGMDYRIAFTKDGKNCIITDVNGNPACDKNGNILVPLDKPGLEEKIRRDAKSHLEMVQDLMVLKNQQKEYRIPVYAGYDEGAFSEAIEAKKEAKEKNESKQKENNYINFTPVDNSTVILGGGVSDNYHSVY